MAVKRRILRVGFGILGTALFVGGFFLHIWLWFGWPQRERPFWADTSTICFSDFSITTGKFCDVIVHGVVLYGGMTRTMWPLDEISANSTQFTIKPLEIYKGNRFSPLVNFWMPGGCNIRGNTGYIQQAHPEIGEEVMAFLIRTSGGKLIPFYILTVKDGKVLASVSYSKDALIPLDEFRKYAIYFSYRDWQEGDPLP